MSQHLYRHFNKEGVLLYVGVSSSALRRLTEHAGVSHWFSTISQVTIEHFENRKDVLAAERSAIIKEKPRHNLMIPSDLSTRREEKLRQADESRTQLLNRTVNFNLAYSPSELATVLGIGPTAVKRLIASGDIGTVALGNKLRTTGWQLVDYLERMQIAQGVKNDRRTA